MELAKTEARDAELQSRKRSKHYKENVLEEDTYVAVKKFSSYSIYVLKGC